MFESSLIVALMVALMYCDPFGFYRKITDILRLKFWIFVKEPKLLYYASIYIGSLFAKTTAIFVMMLLVVARGDRVGDILALKVPSSSAWRRFIAPFFIFSIGLRLYYALDPLIPNLPIRFIFPEAMLTGNAVCIFSVLFVAPIAEEAIFRGYLFTNFRRAMNAPMAILITSLVFTAMHFTGLTFDPVYFASIFCMGLILGILRERTGSVFVAMLFHGIYNFVSIAIGALIYFIVGY